MGVLGAAWHGTVPHAADTGGCSGPYFEDATLQSNSLQTCKDYCTNSYSSRRLGGISVGTDHTCVCYYRGDVAYLGHPTVYQGVSGNVVCLSTMDGAAITVLARMTKITWLVSHSTMTRLTVQAGCSRKQVRVAARALWLSTAPATSKTVTM